MLYVNVGDLVRVFGFLVIANYSRWLKCHAEQVKEHGFHAGKDPSFDTHIIDDESEDRVREC